jgi:hypothetical protein
VEIVGCVGEICGKRRTVSELNLLLRLFFFFFLSFFDESDFFLFCLNIP